MRISIHQSHYLPWLRYFNKIARSDVFVLLDDAQFNRNGYQNRNRVKGSEGCVLLTVPVLQGYQQNLQDVQCNNTVQWQRKHWRTLQQHYRKAPFFERYEAGLRQFYVQPWSHLMDLNRAMLTWFLEQLGIHTPVVSSHTLGIHETATARLLSICRAVGATEYLSGAHAVGTYLDARAFEEAGVRLVSQSWTSPVYPQLYPDRGYAGDLSIVDLLFMEGERSLEVLRCGGAVRQEGMACHG